jgi:hypothetical protein
MRKITKADNDANLILMVYTYTVYLVAKNLYLKSIGLMLEKNHDQN